MLGTHKHNNKSKNCWLGFIFLISYGLYEYYNNISFFTCSITADPEQTHDVDNNNNDAPSHIYVHSDGGHDINDDPFVQEDSITHISDEDIPRKRKRIYYDDPIILSNR